MTKKRTERLLRLLGPLIGLAGLGIVVFRLVSGWSRISTALAGGQLFPIGAAVLAGLIGMSLIGFNWGFLLGTLGTHLGVSESLARYFVGQLGKYVPGGIWPIIGRAEMARRSGVEGAAAYVSTLLSLTFTYLAALLTAALFFSLADGAGTGLVWAPWVLLIIPIGFVLLHPTAIETALRKARKVTGRNLRLSVPEWSKSALLTAMHIPSWVAIAAATYLTLVGIGSSAEFAQVAFATCMSWFLGFIVVGLPGGLGVREAVFTALMASLDPAIAAAVAIAARLVFVAVDLLGATISSIVFSAIPQRKIDS